MLQASTRAVFHVEWERNGTAKVPEFLSPRDAAELRTATNASYDLLSRRLDRDPATVNEHLADHFRRWQGLWLKELWGFLDSDAPDIHGTLADLLATAQDRFRSLFDQTWALEPAFTFVRRHQSTRHYLPWHIDADAGSILNTTDYSINAWLPLDAVGDRAPSLELMPGSNQTMRTLPLLAHPNVSRDDEWVKVSVGGEPWVPRAVPGDAILFDHWTLHRTQRLADESASRISWELRFVRRL
jgi:hypothetical protein